MGAPIKTLMDRFKKTQVVPVVVIDDVVMAVPAAQALPADRTPSLREMAAPPPRPTIPRKTLLR